MYQLRVIFRSELGEGPRIVEHSSRIRPANDRETSRNEGKRRAKNSQVQDPDSGIVAGSETGPENTLKVETRVRTPLGQLDLPAETS